MQESPLVSVVVPMYNSEKYLNETIQSVIRQTYLNWELICVDDGSNDDSLTIVSEYIEKDKRIRLLVRDKLPKGGSHCRNIGGFAARGEYLIFLDSDDLLAPTCIERRVIAIKDSGLDFVVFPMARFQNDDLSTAVRGTRSNIKDYLYYYASGNAGWQITSPITRTSFFKENGGFDIRYLRLQDVEYNLRALMSSNGNYMVMNHVECDCYYRWTSFVALNDSEKIEKALCAYELFHGLVCSNIECGNLSNSSLNSRALLNIYSNAFILTDILRKKGEKVNLEAWFNTANQSLTGYNRLIYSILKMTVPYYALNYWLARFSSKFARNRFLR